MKLYIYAAVFFTCVSLFTWIWQDRYNAGYDAATAETLRSATLAVEVTRKQEQEKQEKVNEATQTQYNELNRINSRLNRDLDRLRKRANRSRQSESSRANCTGATGKELSAEDAGFLTREAARADRIRAGLKTCYQYADTVADE